jgi:chromosome partitioning protein
MSRIFSIIQQKGGVGKTTSVASVLSWLDEMGYRVLGVDADGQGNLADCFGVDKLRLTKSLYDVMLKRCTAEEAIVRAPLAERPRLDILPATILLAGVDLDVGQQMAREFLLKHALDKVRSQYDFILVDCGPHLSLMTTNAMACSDQLLVPLEASWLCVQGLAMLVKTVQNVQDMLNPDITFAGAFFTKVNHTKDSREIIEQISEELSRRAIHVFETRIRMNVKLQEAPRTGVPVDLASPRSYGADDYQALTREIIERCGSEKGRSA